MCGDGCLNPYGQAFEDELNNSRSWQRSPDGGPGWWLLGEATPGAANLTWAHTSVLFARVQYGAQPFGAQMDEFVELVNLGTTAINLQGCVLRDMQDQGQEFTLPEWGLDSGARVRVYTGEVPLGMTGISLGREAPIWNNRLPDSVELRSAPAFASPEGVSIAETQYWTDWALAAVWLSIAWGEVE
jgi:hypothetical protein